jgi:hypothetical protein
VRRKGIREQDNWDFVVVHFITTNWELAKIIIIFRLIDCSYGAGSVHGGS